MKGLTGAAGKWMNTFLPCDRMVWKPSGTGRGFPGGGAWASRMVYTGQRCGAALGVHRCCLHRLKAFPLQLSVWAGKLPDIAYSEYLCVSICCFARGRCLPSLGAGPSPSGACAKRESWLYPPQKNPQGGTQREWLRECEVPVYPSYPEILECQWFRARTAWHKEYKENSWSFFSRQNLEFPKTLMMRVNYLD